MVKRNGAREDFVRDKMFESMRLACRKRPVGTDLLREAVQKVERSLFQDYEDEVPSHAIGELVMESLHDIDKVAYVRFASVYRDFTSVEDFIQIVQSIDPFVPALAGKTFQGRAL